MKTIKQKASSSLKVLKQLAIAFAITLASANSNSLSAQDRSFGLTIRNNWSMGGLAATISPQASYQYKRHEAFLGLNMQYKHKNITGFRTGYSFALNPEDDNEVFLFCELACFNKAYLSTRLIRFESIITPENASYFQNARISSSEQYIGFGVKFMKRGPVNLFGAIGAGFYTTYGIKDSKFRYRDLTSASVMLTFGVSAKISR